ncbi:MAG TPA: hypothetical protein VGN16_15775 [Acidobacteriaceae bacterium]|jgi:hypothetical protein
MSKVVYLVGHGRVAANVVTIMPRRTTMHWLGHLGDVSNGISYAFLSGRLTAELGISGPGSEVNEHYLCGERADIDPVTDTKIKNFFDRNTPNPLGVADPYVLYPRGKINVSLTSIIEFLRMLSPMEEWHLYWTCCRGYIGQRNAMTSTYNRATNQVEQRLRHEPEPTPALNDQNHQTVNADFDNIRLIARSDQAVVQAGTTEGLTKRQAMFAARPMTEVIERFLMRV